MFHAPNRQELAPLQKISLLFVEDDKDVREATAKLLKRYFLSLHDAPNGQEGLEFYRQYKPDIVLTDVTMPIMDGLEMSRKIKEENESVPIIVTSAHNELDFFVEAIDIGIDRYILKPTNMGALLYLLLKSAQPILKQRTLESQRQLIQHLLELSSSPTLIASSSHPEIANKAFREFLGCASDAELRAQFERAKETALIDSAIKQAEQLDCLEQARSNPDVLSRILQSSNKKIDSFEVARFDMPDVEKYMFTLKPKLN